MINISSIQFQICSAPWKRYVDDKHTVLAKTHSQDFTDQLKSKDDDIKWMTERQFIIYTLRDEVVNIYTRTERALASLDIWYGG